VALRVCGASEERDALSAARCWCRGLFCGKGGYQRSKEFRREYPASSPAASVDDFNAEMRQADLFSGDDRAQKWRARLEAHAPPRAAKRKGPAAPVDVHDEGIDA